MSLGRLLRGPLFSGKDECSVFTTWNSNLAEYPCTVGLIPSGELPLPSCLYCTQENRTFSSVEHILLEGLGNNGRNGRPEIVLPKGVICDKCNHGKLSDLDNFLAEFSPIAYMKTFYGIPSKEGALPKAKFSNATMEMVAPGNMRFNSSSKKSFQVQPGGFKTNTLSNRRMTSNNWRKLTRTLFKIALGFVYLDHSPEMAMSERFDPVRRMILGLDKFHGYLMFLKKVENPPQTINVQWGFLHPNEEAVWIALNYFGVALFTDLEIRKPRHPELVPNDLVQLRACANRRVAYVSTGDTKAVESPGELPAVGLDFPIGASSYNLLIRATAGL